MKTIGLLGGMSWKSTVSYYQLINQGVKEKLGGLHSAKIAMFSVDFEPIERLQHSGDWKTTAEILIDAARKIELAGADFIVICTNTMHKVAPDIERSINVPILNIADATALRLKAMGIAKVGLLGTAFTMEQNFYKGRLTQKYGLEVIVPKDKERKNVHDIIYQELCLGQILTESKNKYLAIIDSLKARGAEAVILGCTEIGLLVKQENTSTPLLDTTVIHTQEAVNKALSDD